MSLQNTCELIHSPLCAFYRMNFAACSCINLLPVTSTCRLISGDEIKWYSFCACEHLGTRKCFQEPLDPDSELEVDKSCASLTQRKSEFEKRIRVDRPIIEPSTLHGTVISPRLKTPYECPSLASMRLKPSSRFLQSSLVKWVLPCPQLL